MHLDDATVQALLDGALTGAPAADAEAHLRSCGVCAELVERERREHDALRRQLALLDHSPPPVTAVRIGALASTRPARWIHWAAAVLLSLGLAATAYAVPGSPLRSWVSALLGGEGGDRSPVESPVPPPPAPPASAGIKVPAGSRLIIELSHAPAEGMLRIRLDDVPDVAVQAPNGSASFHSEVDRLIIDNRVPSAGIEIRIPRDAPRVEIRIAGARAFLKLGDQITAGGPPDSTGAYHLPISESPP